LAASDARTPLAAKTAIATSSTVNFISLVAAVWRPLPASGELAFHG
jgi:hypothetical protein